METKPSFSILFVCTGNTCRSPMAEFILANRIEKQKIMNVFSRSAGIHPAVNFPFPEESRLALKEWGIENFSHHAKPVTNDLLASSDLVLAMEESHRQFLQKNFQIEDNNVFLLKEFAEISDGHSGVPDPFGQSVAVYRDVRDEIGAAIDCVIDRLKRENKI